MTLSQPSPIAQPSSNGGLANSGPVVAEACGDRDGLLAISDKRNAPRITLLIRAAKLIAGESEFLVVVRDVSHQGIKVRTFHPLPADAAFALELASGERHEVERIWQDGEISGFRFRDPVALEKLLADGPVGKRKRAVRLRLRVPIEVLASGRRDGALFLDISQSGACISCDEHLAIGERIRIECPGVPELTAGIRWRRRPLYGLNFEQTFSIEGLALMTARFAAITDLTAR